MTDLVTLKNLSLSIRNQKILSNINLTLTRGECVTIVGASGSGKSTLALAILGLLKPSEGSIIFHQDVPKPKAQTVQMIWQDVHSSLNPTISIKDLISEPLRILKTYSKAEQQKEIFNTLELVNLPRTILDLKPHKLSGGQKQRVAIAKAIVCRPELLICDEPLSSLDTLNQSLILELFKKIQQEYKNTLLFITHDMSAAYYIADTIAVMDKGQIVEHAPKEQIFCSPLHEKTQELLDAIPLFSLKSEEALI
ncbi:ABC transporter ATP-binding protein [Chlamydia sp. 17-3921]|uniref:ABC transporter ATP-binding protein n=1 Tax=Chlamydia sp. 17-3921 TaxID=2675798 RepID=UPI001919F81C|nr:ABC transporter ATP-binding protein [Chlamydia sp. 17-3921]